MIWESKMAMAIIDLVIVAAVLVSGYTFFSYRRQLRGTKANIALVSILLGQLIFAGLYFLDLLVMTVFPIFMTEHAAASIMEAIQLESGKQGVG